MSIKESSDELNPNVPVAESLPVRPHDRSGSDYLALGIATCGVGFLPLAPGTWGSLVGVVIFLGLRSLAVSISYRSSLNPQTAVIALEILTILVVTFLGIWAASRTERLLGRKDPGKVVVDEVAGQMISLLPVPLVLPGSWKVWVIVSFILFRFFDIVKPYPARRLEGLHGGLGIMADDLVAGVYAAITMLALVLIFGKIFL